MISPSARHFDALARATVCVLAQPQANQSFTRQAQGLIKSTFERLGTAGVGVGGGGAGGSGV